MRYISDKAITKIQKSQLYFFIKRNNEDNNSG